MGVAHSAVLSGWLLSCGALMAELPTVYDHSVYTVWSESVDYSTIRAPQLNIQPFITALYIPCGENRLVIQPYALHSWLIWQIVLNVQMYSHTNWSCVRQLSNQPIRLVTFTKICKLKYFIHNLYYAEIWCQPCYQNKKTNKWRRTSANTDVFFFGKEEHSAHY